MQRFRVFNLISQINNNCKCPAHSNTSYVTSMPSELPSKDYAFQMVSSTVRYGPGVTREIGQDIRNLKSKNVLVLTDKNLSSNQPVKTTLDSLSKASVKFDVFDSVEIEPTDSSLLKAVNFAKKGSYDAYVAVGGGSVLDTCKAANLLASNPNNELLDYVNPPIGRGATVETPLKPMIAVPTTSGTGSETTGVCVFDYEPLKTKTGISNRALRPTLGIIDPLHTTTVPERVAAFTGFDVLCHALESYTAIPYNERSPCPTDPALRPPYNGSNPVSDVWAEYALKALNKFFKRSVYQPDDTEARSAMHLAATMAGIGYGNAGVHLCHGMAYPIAGNVKNFVPADYSVKHAIIPHGLSVVITAPAVFKFTSSACPDRHLRAAELLGTDIRRAHRNDAGDILADTLRSYMLDMKIDNGLQALGYNESDINALVEGTLPQERVTKLAPRAQSFDDLAQLLRSSLTVY